jgi:GDP-mannose 6-dehydrogenase
MKISVIGLGFVGSVTAGCFAEMGHDVIGVDVDADKVELFARGRAPVTEPGIDELMTRGWRAGRLSATADLEAAVARSELSLICVGTGSRHDGSQDIGAIEHLVQRIGSAIARTSHCHSVVVRSTVLPGTTRGRFLPVLQRAVGRPVGESFGLAVNPEFMREGSAVADFWKPPRIVIGEIDAKTADKLAAIYDRLASTVFRTSAEVAEGAKYVDNSWHALKVAFANEIGMICRATGLDSRALMEIFYADDVLNMARAYLRPGFAFGGPCLPKDVAALVRQGAALGLELPILSRIAASNERVIDQGVRRILLTGHARIAMLGLTHKAGICDLRGSPYIEVVKRLNAAGRSVRAFDPNVHRGRAEAAQHGYTDGVISALDEILVEDLDELLAWAQTVVSRSTPPNIRLP